MAHTPLPATFRFSQASLQDYVDCQRRFQLRYVLMQPWPALITDSPADFERHVQRAADFHRLAHQFYLGTQSGPEPGLTPERLTETIDDAELLRWWSTFLAQPPPGLPQTVRRPEVVLTAPLAGHRLLAKFDLLAAEPSRVQPSIPRPSAAEPGRLVVVDWKTVRKRPPRAVLARRLQTRVYQTLAVEAGAAFFGGQPPAPEQVEMLYWFATGSGREGGRVEQFAYDSRQHAADRAYLASLISEIDAHQEPIWPLTPDVELCRFCNYRSLCDRGVKAGFFEELEVELESAPLEIDLEQIAEIEY